MGNDLNDHTVNKLTDAVKSLVDEIRAVRDTATAGLVSRTDLAETEARLAARIGEAWSIGDQYELDSLLEFARRRTVTLERICVALKKLDAQSPKTACECGQQRKVCSMANQAVAMFATQMKAYEARDQVSIDGVIAATVGITADEAASAALIAQLQASQGDWTAEDQAALDELGALSKAKTEKLEAAKVALDALDATLPPPMPRVP